MNNCKKAYYHKRTAEFFQGGDGRKFARVLKHANIHEFAGDTGLGHTVEIFINTNSFWLEIAYLV